MFFIYRIAIWLYIKLILTCWLVLPHFNGAAYVYRNFIRPFYMNPQSATSKIWYVPRKKDFFSKPDDVLTAAERYIQEHGPEAFERLITKVWLKAICLRRSSHFLLINQWGPYLFSGWERRKDEEEQQLYDLWWWLYILNFSVHKKWCLVFVYPVVLHWKWEWSWIGENLLIGLVLFLPYHCYCIWTKKTKSNISVKTRDE